MSRFEERRADLARAWATRSGDDDVPALGLLALAEGLAEVIALLRPLVDTVTAQPEPLKVTNAVPCGHYGPVTDRGAWGVKRHQCTLSMGHTGVHTDGDTSEVTW
jgi:hypothetical protein